MGAVAQNIFHQVDEDFTQVLGGEEYLHYSVSYLVPGLAAYFRELKLVDIVIRVHFQDLFSGGTAQQLDDLHKLIDVAIPLKEWLCDEHLGQHAPS